MWASKSNPMGLRMGTLAFGGCAFPPVSLGPAGDCPRVQGLSEGSLGCLGKGMCHVVGRACQVGVSESS
jgi:hypothetical protein